MRNEEEDFYSELKPLEFLLLMFLEISYVFFVVVDAIVGLLYYITWLL